MKLYKNTLILSLVVFTASLICSTIFRFCSFSSSEVISFLCDYAIGIACSIIVVMATTFLQFKYEQQKILSEVLTEIGFLFFRYYMVAMSLDPKVESSAKLWEYYYDSIEKDIKGITTKLSSLEWFSPKRIKTTMELRKSIISLKIDISLSLSTSPEAAVKVFVGHKVLHDIKEHALQLSGKDEYEKKRITEYFEKAQKCLEDISKEG